MIHQFRQLTQEKEESYDDFATSLKQAAGPCDFPTDWRDVEIQLQLIEKGKSRRVRRRLLNKSHTLTEALDFARAQEMSDKQAERIEIDRQSHGTDTNPEEKLDQFSYVGNRARYEFIELDISTGLEQIDLEKPYSIYRVMGSV